MRFKTYLIENEETFEISDSDIQKVRDDCKIFINWQKAQSYLMPIYRGKNNLPKAINKLTRRKNRIPMNTRPKINRILDDLLNKKFHWKPRSSGVFTCGDFDLVGGYGAQKLFFPIGNYRYVWSTKEDDLFLSKAMSDINYTLTQNAPEKKVYASGFTKTDIVWIDKTARAKAVKLLEGLVDDCIDYDLHKALKTNREIMFDVDKYYLISDRKDHYNDRELDILPKLFKRIIG